MYPPVDDGFNPFAHQQQQQGEISKVLALFTYCFEKHGWLVTLTIF